MNDVFIIGRSGADAELRYLPAGTPVLTLSVAVNEKRENEYIAHWFRVTAFAKTAEMMATRIKKGSELFVRGKLVSRSWDDKATGQKRHSVEIIANWLRVIEKNESPTANGSSETGFHGETSGEKVNTFIDASGDIPF